MTGSKQITQKEWQTEIRLRADDLRVLIRTVAEFNLGRGLESGRTALHFLLTLPDDALTLTLLLHVPRYAMSTPPTLLTLREFIDLILNRNGHGRKTPGLARVAAYIDQMEAGEVTKADVIKAEELTLSLEAAG